MITIKCTYLEQAYILSTLDKSQECLFEATHNCKDNQTCRDCMLENIDWIITDKEENQDG